VTEEQNNKTIKDQIIGLLLKGYKRAQLIHDFDFAERTVDAAIREYKELSNGNGGNGGESGRTITDDEASTPPSKSGGKAAIGGRDGSLAIRKEKESVLPEWLESDVAEIFDGQTRDQRIFLAGMSVPLMGLRLFVEGVKPIIDLLATWQEGQAQAARLAQGSGIEMAKEAGEAAASSVAKFFMDTKPWLSAAPDPWRAMVVDSMRPIFQQVTGQLMGTLLKGFGTPMAGATGALGQPTQSQRGQPAAGQSNVQQSTFEPATIDEVKEAFGDA